MTNEITVNPFPGSRMEYIVDLEAGKVWVLKGGRNGRSDYRSTITSERKIKKMIKLAQAQQATQQEISR